MINNVQLRDAVATALIEAGATMPTSTDISEALCFVGSGESIWFDESETLSRCQFCGHRAPKEDPYLKLKHETHELINMQILVRRRLIRQKGGRA